MFSRWRRYPSATSANVTGCGAVTASFVDLGVSAAFVFGADVRRFRAFVAVFFVVLVVVLSLVLVSGHDT